MAAPPVNPSRLANTITCHAWNADGTRVALCPNNNEIHIYAKSGNGYTLEHKLTEHDQVVTGIDWAPKSNRIVSCSQDRNAYVWTFKDNKWKPVLVILRINRAATDVKWSPDENKFAVASGAKCVSVCYFEEDNDWWVSKHIKKHRSIVLKVAWHPSSVLIATASTDFKARVFSAAIKGVDKGAPNTPFGSKIGFGELLAEVDSLGWVQSVKWSPSGNKLAFVAQDSTLTVADVSSGQASVETVKHRALPFRDLTWANETSIIVVGHDNNPTLFQNQGGWKLIKKLDTSAGAGAGAGAAAAAKGPSAFSVFQNKVDKGETATETKLDTKHQNCITAIVPYKVQAGNLVQYSTTSVDGQLLLWDAPK